MRNQFTDIYSFLGINRENTAEQIKKKIKNVVKEAKNLNQDGKISDRKLEAVLISADLLSDDNRRKEYNKKGHDLFVDTNNTQLQEIEFIGGENLYEDFYDLLDVSQDSSESKIKKETAIKMKKMHPDSGSDQSITPEQFETIKQARQVLTDPDRRQKYDDMGHNAYVKEKVDSEIRGFGFTGTGSLIDTVKNESNTGDRNIDDLVEFKSTASREDPTKTAVEEDSANPSSEKNSIGSENDMSDAVKKRKELRDKEEKAKKKRREKNKKKKSKSNQASGSSSSGLIVALLSFITGFAGMMIITTVIVASFTYILYLYMDVLGIGIGVIMGLGMYMIIIKRK